MVLSLKRWKSRSPPGIDAGERARTHTQCIPPSEVKPSRTAARVNACRSARVAGWSSPVARQAHNLKVTGSNPVPATNLVTTRHAALTGSARVCGKGRCLAPAQRTPPSGKNQRQLAKRQRALPRPSRTKHKTPRAHKTVRAHTMNPPLLKMSLMIRSAFTCDCRDAGRIHGTRRVSVTTSLRAESCC